MAKNKRSQDLVSDFIGMNDYGNKRTPFDSIPSVDPRPKRRRTRKSKLTDVFPRLDVDAKSPVIGIVTEDAYGDTSYINGVRRHGGRVAMLTQSVIPEGIAGIVLRGGADVDPALYGEKDHKLLGWTNHYRDMQEYPICEEALERGIPILGICRGHQMLNVVCGGTLYQDLSLRRSPKEKKRKVTEYHEGSKHNAYITHSAFPVHVTTATFRCNSLHHQAVKKAGKGVLITARSETGVVEAIRVNPKNHPFACGFQFHPEMMNWSNVASAIWTAFIEAAKTYKETI